MRPVQLVADTNVLSYIFNRSALGFAYEELIGSRNVGITGHTIAELRAGVVMAQWGERRLAEHLRFLDQFSHVADTREMAEVCGALRAVRSRVGEPIEWADAWAAACAIWLDVPLVTHDRDHEGIPGLRVLTAHDEWCVREIDRGAFGSGPLLLSESPSRGLSLRAYGSAHW
jgi:predicted nucleic acid-binding protein